MINYVFAFNNLKFSILIMRNLLLIIIIIILFSVGGDLPIIRDIKAIFLEGIDYIHKYVNLNEIKRTFSDAINSIKKFINPKG